MGYREFKDELMAGITKGYLDQAASDADKYVPSQGYNVDNSVIIV